MKRILFVQSSMNGINNVKTVFAEGLAMGDEKCHESIDGAREAIAFFAGHAEKEVSYAAS